MAWQQLAGLSSPWLWVFQPAEGWFNLLTRPRTKCWIVFFWVREVQWLSLRRVRVSEWHQAGVCGWEVGRSRRGQGSPMGSSAVSVTSALTQVRMQVRSLQRTLSILQVLRHYWEGNWHPVNPQQKSQTWFWPWVSTAVRRSRQKPLTFRVQMSPFLFATLCSCTGCLPLHMFCLELHMLESGGCCCFFFINTFPNLLLFFY